MPAAKRKPKPRKRAPRRKKADKTKSLARVLVDLHRRVDKLERKERTITGFACAESCVPAEPYRTLEEIAESDDGPFV